MLEQIISALNAKRDEVALEAIRRPKELTGVEYARQSGIQEGFELALQTVESILDEKDQKEDRL